MKLIRDRVPERMKADGYTPKLVTVTGDTLRGWLLHKLIEEAEEAQLDGGSIEELADVYEVLRSLAELRGIPLSTIEHQADLKAREVGAFSLGLLWMDAPTPEADE